MTHSVLPVLVGLLIYTCGILALEAINTDVCKQCVKQRGNYYQTQPVLVETQHDSCNG